MKKPAKALPVKALPIKNPAKRKRNQAMAQAYLQPGATTRTLAKDFSLSRGQVSKILNDDEIKTLVQTSARDMISMLPKAVENYQGKPATRETPATTGFMQSDDENVRMKASDKILAIASILPSHTQSLVVNQIINSTSVEIKAEVTVLSEFITAQLAQAVRDDDDIMDGELEDD